MSHATWLVEGEAGTSALGARLAQLLPAGSVVALNGPLGAGKTRLVQSIAAELGVDRADVTSPTFVLVNEYQGRMPIFHFDAYRLKDDDEFLSLGPDEYFDSGGLSIVEWAERVARCLPEERLEINVEVTGPVSRRFEIIGRGERYAAVVDALRSAG